ncbi:MAG: hypothetical protein GF411_02850 [Candidatus Lokiarchaeota archaeon]|nr:hypothetical protein [Candidatus Lokiarchaeota archaeon]
MSTNDVPGHKACNYDELCMGCWAEHEDGSLIFVQSTESGQVVYSVFDMSKKPPMEYRDRMRESGFKKHFSWDPDDKVSLKWTWHDKTPFPWNKVIESGLPDGVRHACAQHLLTAAEQVAQSRDMIGEPVPENKYTHLGERLTKAGKAILKGIQVAVSELET